MLVAGKLRASYRLLAWARPFQTTSERLQEGGGKTAAAVSSIGMPEVVMEVDEGGKQSVTEEELRARKNASVKAWIEQKVGKDKVELVKLLQKHNVVVRGGPEDGQKFIDALLIGTQRLGHNVAVPVNVNVCKQWNEILW